MSSYTRLGTVYNEQIYIIQTNPMLGDLRCVLQITDGFSGVALCAFLGGYVVL